MVLRIGITKPRGNAYRKQAVEIVKVTYFARDTIFGVTVLAKTVAPKASFFKPLHLLIRAYQIPVLLICPLTLPKV